MIKIVLDDTTGGKLAGAQRCVEVCDSSGRTLGFFTPGGAAILDPQVSDEELARRERDDETFTTTEVQAHLRSL